MPRNRNSAGTSADSGSAAAKLDERLQQAVREFAAAHPDPDRDAERARDQIGAGKEGRRVQQLLPDIAVGNQRHERAGDRRGRRQQRRVCEPVIRRVLPEADHRHQRSKPDQRSEMFFLHRPASARSPSRAVIRWWRSSRKRGFSRVVSWFRGRSSSIGTISATRVGRCVSTATRYRHEHGFLDVMRHQDRREAVLPAQLQHQRLQFHPRQGVDRAEGFVEQQHIRVRGECAGDGDALLHPARQLPGIFVLEAGEADLRDIAAAGLAEVGAACSPRLFEREHHVRDHRAPRKQRSRILLEQINETRRRTGHAPSAFLHDARSRFQQAGNDLQQRRLAAAGGADNGREFSPRCFQRNAVDGDERLSGAVVKDFPDVAERDAGFHA